MVFIIIVSTYPEYYFVYYPSSANFDFVLHTICDLSYAI